MHTFAISALFLTLSSTPALASSTWWTLKWRQGLDCGGTHLPSTTGPGRADQKTVCVPVPKFGFTGSVDWSVAPSSKRTFTLGMHKSLTCKGDGGSYVGGKKNECLNLDGIKAVSVTRHPKKRSVTGRRAVEDLFDEDVDDVFEDDEDVDDLFEDDEGDDEEETPESAGLQERTDTVSDLELSDLEKRKNSCYTPTFVLASGVATGSWIYYAVGTCPATAKEENIHKGQCGLSAVSAVALGFLTTYSAFGLYKHGDQSKRDIDLPYEDTALVDGYSISYTAVDEGSVSHPVPTGHEWSHYRIDHHDLSGKHSNGSTIHSVHVSGKQRISAPVHEDEDETGLVARKEPGVAYYSWIDGNEKKFKKLPVCKTKKVADQMAIHVWNALKNSNSNARCANMHANGYRFSRGEFAVVRGTYTDRAGRC